MGHSGCGGIRASVEKTAARQTEAQFITNWMSLLDDSRTRVKEQLPNASTDEACAAMEWEAIRTSLENLRTFPCIQILEGKGRLSLHGAHFEIATGTLTVLNQATDTFVTI
jgi:carbonic anhydrase